MNSLEYKNNFVVFLDVLGFKNIVNSNNTTKIEKYLSVVEEQIAYIQEIDNKQDIRTIVISDSIIMSIDVHELDVEGKIGKLQNFCLAIALIQSKLSLENIWLRGAISYGLVYFNESKKQIIGKGYIQAYELEQKAIYPRVILDTLIIKELNMEHAKDLIHHINAHLFDNWKGDILFSKQHHTPQDTPLFIDYLENILLDKNETTKLINNIDENIYAYFDVYPKYKWVINYIIEKVGYSIANHELTTKLMSY